jgi:glyoxylase-like metal-dependent hydrolase (beta-lactamase superfamily II)
MKKTFTTVMPDKVGAFLEASRILASLGLNITRVSYNKAVDTHMLFIDVEGDAKAIAAASARLGEIGYLQNKTLGNVILIEFRLRDVPGAVQPVLELIDSYRFNISYISSQENGTDYQYFRMGLFTENEQDVSEFLRQAAKLCAVKIINYNPTGKVLDNTVFYMSFANMIAERCGLSEDEKYDLIVDSNLIMEMLNQKNSPPYKTFDYIGKFAEGLVKYRGADYKARVTAYDWNGLKLTLIEPPCGSNLCLMDTGEGILCVDSGFSCYRMEDLAIIRNVFPDFDTRPKDLLLTHADLDHIGLTDIFDRVFLSRKCYDNFVRENAGKPNLRQRSPAHAPYARISALLTHYKPLPTGNMRVVGGGSEPIAALIEKIGEVKLGQLEFETFEGKGGHVPGEVIYVERRKRLLFTGDIFVNIKSFTPEQTKFNKYAPYLMTSVDTDPKLAAAERQEITSLLDKGKWLLIGGHGAAKELTVD